MTAERPSDELMARVLSGNAHPGDAAAVASWVGTDPARRAELERLQAAWTRAPKGSWDVDRAWTNVARDTADDSQSTMSTPVKHSGSLRPGVGWRIAAALTLTAGLGGAWFALRTGGAAAAQTYVTAAGERRELTLSDGSTVVMAPRSTLTVDPEFGEGSRTLTLDGEAWFSVVHQPDVPFVVETRSHVVRDIGTVFTLWARSGRHVHLAVAEGEVAVRERAPGRTAEHHLAAGDWAAFAADTLEPLWRESNLPLDTLASWRDGTLEVESETAGLVKARLGLWYGVSIVFADTNLNSRSVTATFSLDSLHQAVEVLALLLDATVERNQGEYWLRPRP